MPQSSVHSGHWTGATGGSYLKSEWICKPGIADEVAVGQRKQKGFKVGLILRGQVEPAYGSIRGAQQRAQIGIVLHTRVIELDDFSEALEASVMHVAAAQFDIAQ